MKITCQSCQSKYTVSDEKVQGKTVKIKCRKCGATIMVNSGGVTQTNGAGPPEPAASAGAAPPASDLSFLVNVAEGDQRTMSLAEILSAYNGSVITSDTYVWSDGMGDWKPLGEVDAIVSALNAPTSVPAPAPVPAPEPVAAAAPAPEPAARPAARRDPGRRGPDLFGGGATEEVATSAPVYNGSSMAARGAAAPPPGLRDENSMLFSLSALTAKAAAPAPSSSGAAMSDDSGLIDLKALAASAGAAGPTNLVQDDAGLFPLGAPMPLSAAPIGATAASLSLGPPAKSKTPLYVAVGGLVAVLAIVGAFFGMKGGGEKPVLAVASTAAAAPASAEPTTAPSASEAPSASAAPTSSAVASASASATAKAPGRGGGRQGPSTAPKGGNNASPTPPSAPPPAAAATPAKKSGGCGCAAGDLMCAMRCSAGGH